jgi:predicted DNA binding CopG/RHH family protein
MGDIEIIKDFLPPPDKLVFKEDNVKVTIALNRSSLAFFKKHAAKYHVPYQKMIRNLLDEYVARHNK